MINIFTNLPISLHVDSNCMPQCMVYLVNKHGEEFRVVQIWIGDNCIVVLCGVTKICFLLRCWECRGVQTLWIPPMYAAFSAIIIVRNWRVYSINRTQLGCWQSSTEIRIQIKLNSCSNSEKFWNLGMTCVLQNWQDCYEKDRKCV
jgi:hypothetical protein